MQKLNHTLITSKNTKDVSILLKFSRGKCISGSFARIDKLLSDTLFKLFPAGARGAGGGGGVRDTSHSLRSCGGPH